MAGKILLIVGVILLVLSLCGLGISVMLPVLTEGRTSWEEAMVGIVPGGLCSCISFIITVVGLILVLMGLGKKEPPEEPEPPTRRRR